MIDPAPESLLTALPPEVDGHTYPRLQLQRAHWESLNGKWRFRKDDDKQFGHPREVLEWPQEIRVPFPLESKASGVGDRGFPLACWYQRNFTMHADG